MGVFKKIGLTLFVGVCYLKAAEATGEIRLNAPEKHPGTYQRRLQTELPIVNSVASSFEAPYYSGWAVDGNFESRYASARQDDEWIYVELARNFDLDQVILYWEDAFGSVYDIQVSNNTDNAWTTVASETSGNGGTDTINLPDGTNARYVRMRGIERGPGIWGYSLWEFVVLGDIGTGYDPPASSSLTVRSATASSVRNGRVAARAIDRDDSTRWESGRSDDEWIYVTLDRSYPLFQVVIDWDTSYGDEYEIQVSEDANNWLTVFQKNDGNGNTDTIELPPGTNGRYVRMQGVDRSNTAGYSIVEMYVLGDAASPNTDAVPLVTIGATASASEAPYSAEFVRDGNLDTRWASARNNDQWITIELLQLASIDQVKLFWESAYGRVFEIQTSVNGVVWTTVYTETNGEGGLQQFNLLPSSGKFVRMKGIERGTRYGYSLYEMEVYGILRDTDPSPTPPSQLLPVLETVASSVESPYLASLATDNDFETRWASVRRQDNQWIYVRFDQPYFLTSIQIVWEDAYATSYQVQTSNDGVTWTIVETITGSDGGTDIINFPSTGTSTSASGRFLRILGLTRSLQQYGYSMYEIDVWGFATGAESTPSPTPPSTPPPTSGPAPLLPVLETVASTVESPYFATLATDNDSGTRWASVRGQDNQWIYVRFDQPYFLTRIQIVWEAAYATSYQVQTSNDGVTWTIVETIAGSDGGTDVINFPSTGFQTTSASGRFLRILGLARSLQQYGYSMYEIDVWGFATGAESTPSPTPPSTPPPTSGPAPLLPVLETVASSVESPYVAALATDNDFGTRWASVRRQDDQWIYVRFDQPYFLTSIQIVWEDAYATSYQVQTSNDGVTWTIVETITGSDGGTDVINFPSTGTSTSASGRFLRILGLTRSLQQYGYSIYEIDVWGFATGAESTPSPTPPSTPPPTPPPTTSQVSLLPAQQAVASSEETVGGVSYTADLAIDNNLSTRWSSIRKQDNEWIYVGFAQTYFFTRIDIVWEAAYATNYEVQTSNDGSTWTTVATRTGFEGTDVINFPSTGTSTSASGSYLRVLGLTRALQRYGYSIYEIDAYGFA